MTITKLLCKYLDRDGKGYVTMGNLTTAVGKVAALLTIFAGYVRGVTTIARYWDGNILNALDSALLDAGMIDGVCVLIASLGTGVILTIGLAFVLTVLWIIVEYVWTVKIAKCERKDGDETL